MQILERNPQVYFHLLQQKLIELIRVGKISEALEFAQQELAPRGEKNVIYSKIISLTSVRIQGSNLYQSQCSSSSYLGFCFLVFVIPVPLYYKTVALQLRPCFDVTASEFLGILQQAFLKEIEKTVALLLFEDAENCPYGELLDVSHRLKTANEVNAAILTSQSHEKGKYQLPSSTWMYNINFMILCH
jgi:hypothetical protein